MGLGPGQSVDLPGVHAERRGAASSPPRRRACAAEANPFQYSLSIPGEVEVVEAGAGHLGGPPGTGAPESRTSAPSGPARDVRATAVAVQRRRVAGELKVRSRRPGDALRPIGLGGRKKLQDLLVDRKVAREERDRVPIVVDRSDRIVWVVGHAVAEDFRVTEPAGRRDTLERRRLGGRG